MNFTHPSFSTKRELREALKAGTLILFDSDGIEPYRPRRTALVHGPKEPVTGESQWSALAIVVQGFVKGIVE